MVRIPQRSSKAGALRRSWNLRGPHARLVGALLALVCGCSGVAASRAAAASPSPRVAATQQLAVLLHGQRAYQSPRSSSRVLASVSARRPITGEKTTLPVIGHATGHGGTHWLKVMLPGRPNSSSGWINRAGTRALVTGWHLVVNTAGRQVRIYSYGQIAKRFSAVVGKASTPTPTGKFFVEETVIMPASEAGGPFALALSARSNVLQEFDGGPGQIAIHGRDSLGGVLGTAASHGCIRLATSDITWLAARIGPGVPVTIY